MWIVSFFLIYLFSFLCFLSGEERFSFNLFYFFICNQVKGRLFFIYFCLLFIFFTKWKADVFSLSNLCLLFNYFLFIFYFPYQANSVFWIYFLFMFYFFIKWRAEVFFFIYIYSFLFVFLSGTERISFFECIFIYF